MRRLIAQSCTRPVPPSSLIARVGFPESSRMVSTSGAAARASSTEPGPDTWITWTRRTSGRSLRRRRSSTSSSASTSCTAVVPQRRCCAATASASVNAVSRNVSVGGGTAAAIAAMSGSSIGPGPLGIAETRPIVEAPVSMASRASSRLAMQHIFTNIASPLLPDVSFLLEPAVLWPHHAEPLARRRFHHDPGLHLADPPGAELLEALHFGLDVVRLDVEVDAAVVIHGLHLDVQALAGHLELDVVVTFLARQRLGGQAERRGPETRSAVQVGGPAIDDEARQPALVHPSAPRRIELQLHVDVAARVVGGMRPGGVTESQPLVEPDRIGQPAVGFEEHAAKPLLARPGRPGAAEQFADAATLVRRCDAHLGELAAAIPGPVQRNRADDRVAVEREEDHAPGRDDCLPGVVEHLEVGRLDLEQSFDPLEVEPAEIGRVSRPERLHRDGAQAIAPSRHSRASNPRITESWIAPPTYPRPQCALCRQ